MSRVEKTVFLSYRRTNAPWALAIFQALTHDGYDVFFDFMGIGSGDFEQIILENIRARAHFIVLLTPSALEKCSRDDDWLRREIEFALSMRRNVVPLMLEGFSFGSPAIATQLTGRLAELKKYQALEVPAAYFPEAMARLRDRYLNVPLKAVLHPVSPAVQEVAEKQQQAATIAPVVKEPELMAQGYFERAHDVAAIDDRIRLYSEAIRLKPDFLPALANRGGLREAQGDIAGALEDYNEALRVRPDYVMALANRANLHKSLGDFVRAQEDYDEVARLERLKTRRVGLKD